MRNELIQINSKNLQIKEYQNQRVLTFKDIDTVHERVGGTASRNFRENRDKLIEGTDYFNLSYEELRATNFVDRPNSQGLIIITESGYLMLVKTLTDDLAWKVQRQLVNTYFRVKKLSQQEMMRIQLGMIDDHEERLSKLENNMTLDFGQQRRIQNKAKSTVLTALGGVNSPAYKDRSVSSKVFSAIWRDYKDYFSLGSYRDTSRVDFDKAIEYLEGWKPQGKLLREIEQFNNQLEIENVI